MWPRRKERDLPLLSPTRLWQDVDADDDEWEDQIQQIPKKYIRTSAADYNHDYVVGELQKLQEKEDEHFANREASPARTPDDMVLRLPLLKLSDLLEDVDGVEMNEQGTEGAGAEAVDENSEAKNGARPIDAAAEAGKGDAEDDDDDLGLSPLSSPTAGNTPSNAAGKRIMPPRNGVVEAESGDDAGDDEVEEESLGDLLAQVDDHDSRNYGAEEEQEDRDDSVPMMSPVVPKTTKPKVGTPARITSVGIGAKPSFLRAAAPPVLAAANRGGNGGAAASSGGFPAARTGPATLFSGGHDDDEMSKILGPLLGADDAGEEEEPNDVGAEIENGSPAVFPAEPESRNF
eukprot:g5695.t1